MAKLQNMRMWETLASNPNIKIEKSFFGLRSTAWYTTTGQRITARTLEYAQHDGDHLLSALSQSSADDIIKRMGDTVPTPTVNGNYMLEFASSADKSFLALRLLQFQQMIYEPVTPTLTFEGDEAQKLIELFSNAQ